MALASSYQSGRLSSQRTTASGKKVAVVMACRSALVGCSPLVGGAPPVKLRAVARQPLPGGKTNSSQPSRHTRSHASSWLPRRQTTFAGGASGEGHQLLDDVLRAGSPIQVVAQE